MAPLPFTEEQVRSMQSLSLQRYIMTTPKTEATSGAQTPATASTDSTQAVDYFGPATQTSTTTNSSRTSIDGGSDTSASAVAVQKPKAVNPVPALSRDFPKPAKDINVAEALTRKPGRWTIEGSRAAVLPARVVDEEQVKAKRRRDLEEAKKDLFASSAKLNSMTLPTPKDL
ncbi:hypothetical protein C8034_v011269 [Colletotrichum sidae]|uniref:Uncharacterized protein n=1 Tax=Colletotrichum sidae TaxID=1347389 RepID=A0A4R8TC91_9PEZI|nr:hypothetical protein C8034_v011269 [Colletotrichum sidae]